MCGIGRGGLCEKLSQCLKEQNAYFKEAREEIAEKNVRLLHLFSLSTFYLVAFLILITPCIVSGWKVTIQYYVFLSAMLVFVLFSSWYSRRPARRASLVTEVCIFFYITLVGCVLAIDIFPYPGSPASFMPMVLMTLPVVFILQAQLVFPILLGSEIVYVAVDSAVKAPALAQNDVFNSVAGLLFSLVIFLVIMSLRMEDSSVKNRYKQLSTIDALTSMLNKATSRERAELYLSSRNSTDRCAFMIFDVDDFKMVNDKLGHQTGDRLLEQIGALLLHSFRVADVVGRFGGDEFTALLKDIMDIGILARKCAEIQRAAGQLAYEQGIPCVGFSIGIVVIEGESPTFDEMFTAADQALYEAKAQGKDCFVIQKMCGKVPKKDRMEPSASGRFDIVRPEDS